jgi:hypothetical protein
VKKNSENLSAPTGIAYPQKMKQCPMYDSRFCCQAKTARRLPLWSGRCQGRRTLVFILTLDTDPATSTIGMGSNLGCSF